MGKPKRRQKWITVRGTKRAARARLAELVRDTHGGELVLPHKSTLGAWLDKAIKSPSRTPRASETKRSVIERHLKPKLGAIPLQQLTAADLRRYYDEDCGRAQDPLAPATLEQHHTIVHSTLQAAVHQGETILTMAETSRRSSLGLWHPPRRPELGREVREAAGPGWKRAFERTILSR